MEEQCDYEESCLNTRGSYLCVPTPCPSNYVRDDETGQCAQFCDQMPNNLCSDGAHIAQSISYPILSLKHLDPSIPFLKLVSYDIANIPLEYTKFTFDEKSNSDVFYMELIPNRNGIVYLYANDNFKSDQIYKLKITANSYDQLYRQLLYITKYVIYVSMH